MAVVLAPSEAQRKCLIHVLLGAAAFCATDGELKSMHGRLLAALAVVCTDSAFIITDAGIKMLSYLIVHLGADRADIAAAGEIFGRLMAVQA